ncbi:hypothetical protein B566_EDAN014763 [Ephemera danica]|nr:hypothetical protein B566_EDAN014763 [Ephemera danica]
MKLYMYSGEFRTFTVDSYKSSSLNMKFFLHFFMLALLVLAGMVSAECPSSCKEGERICAKDPASTSGNGGYQEFRSLCEMQRTNCNTGKSPYT